MTRHRPYGHDPYFFITALAHHPRHKEPMMAIKSKRLKKNLPLKMQAIKAPENAPINMPKIEPRLSSLSTPWSR